MTKRKDTDLRLLGSESGVHDFDKSDKTPMIHVPFADLEKVVRVEMHKFCESRLGFEEDIKTRLGVAVAQSVEVESDNRRIRKTLLGFSIVLGIVSLVTIALFSLLIMRTDGRYTEQDAAADAAHLRLWTTDKINEALRAKEAEQR